MLVFVIKKKIFSDCYLCTRVYPENADKNRKETKPNSVIFVQCAIHTTIEFDVYVICLLTCSVLSENEQTHHNQMWIKYQFKIILFFILFLSDWLKHHKMAVVYARELGFSLTLWLVQCSLWFQSVFPWYCLLLSC